MLLVFFMFFKVLANVRSEDDVDSKGPSDYIPLHILLDFYSDGIKEKHQEPRLQSIISPQNAAAMCNADHVFDKTKVWI